MDQTSLFVSTVNDGYRVKTYDLGNVQVVINPSRTQRDQRRTNRNLDAGCVQPHWKPKGKGKDFKQ